MKKLLPIILSLGLVVGWQPVLVRADSDVPDGSFENLDFTWQCDDNCINPSTFYIVPGSSTAVDGDYYAYIFHQAGLYQDLTIPSGVNNLSFYYQNINDGDETGALTVTLSNPDSGEIYATNTFSDQGTDWFNGLLAIPDNLAGDTVRLSLINVSGFNRIDALTFTATTEAVTSTHATIKLYVLSAANKKVKNAKVYIKNNGKKVSLLNLKTNETVKSVTTTKKGATPKFEILKDLTTDTTVKVCISKSGVTECAAITPEMNMLTTYDFSFSNITISALIHK